MFLYYLSSYFPHDIRKPLVIVVFRRPLARTLFSNERNTMPESVALKPTAGFRKRNLSLGSLCLGSMCIGLTLGWPESSLSYILLIHCDDKCYDLSSNGSATVQMIMNFGSCIGALVPPCIADVYGRRSTFALAALSNFTFWFILVTFRGHLEIICGAVLAGFATGIYVTTTALYVSEISPPQSRGAIGALAAFFAYVGGLFGSCLIFITYDRIISSIMASLAMMFLISIRLWMVESPYYFFMRGKTLEAKMSLKALRGARRVLDVDEEFKSIELFFQSKRYKPPKEGRCNMCNIPISSRKGKYAILGIGFLYISHMVGDYGMEDYSKSFLIKVIPNYGKILVPFINVYSIAVCLYTIEKFGRRPILIAISIVGSSISCLILGIFTLTKHGAPGLTKDDNLPFLLPATILVLYYFVYSLGLSPILPILTAELFPSRGKTMILSLCISFIYFCSMAIQSIFEILNDKQGSDLAFASFAIVGSLGIPIAFLFIPETQGKTLHEIQNELEDFTILVF